MFSTLGITSSEILGCTGDTGTGEALEVLGGTPDTAGKTFSTTKQHKHVYNVTGAVQAE